MRRAMQRVVQWAAVVGCAAVLASSPAVALEMLQTVPNPLLPPTRLIDDPATAGNEDPTTGGVAAVGAEDKSDKSAYVLPVLLSALVPGTGEIAAGHPWRGLPLIAIDVATWIGYAHYRQEGADKRAEYEAYADAHWNYERFGDTNGNGDRDPGEVWGWQESLERYYGETQTDPALQWWNPEAPYNCNCPYVSKEDDRQHYYENIGKYRYYWQGWDDWLYNPADPHNSDSQSHRREYGLMRIDSNESYDNATSLVVVGMATRLVSVIQSALLVRADLNEAQQFSMRPVLLPGRAAGIEMRLAY